MPPIIIPFTPNYLGRVIFNADVITGDLKSFDRVVFKLDSGSDFTTIEFAVLLSLGYTREFLKNCPSHDEVISTAYQDNKKPLQYISNISIKFEDRELQGCRIFFALDSNLKSLFGSDILKYFNWGVNYDEGIFHLNERKNAPLLQENEHPIHIYSLETQERILA